MTSLNINLPDIQLKLKQKHRYQTTTNNTQRNNSTFNTEDKTDNLRTERQPVEFQATQAVRDAYQVPAQKNPNKAGGLGARGANSNAMRKDRSVLASVAARQWPAAATSSSWLRYEHQRSQKQADSQKELMRETMRRQLGYIEGEVTRHYNSQLLRDNLK